MKEISINKTFAILEEKTKWVEENCADGKYQGQTILLISSEESVFDNSVTINNIMVF